MKINGRKVKASGYCTIKNPRPVTEIEFGMTLHREPLPGDNSRVAMLWGPIVLAGILAHVDNPFSDPSKYNDYYTYDYGSAGHIRLEDFEADGPLSWKTASGIAVKPFYEAHHCRYVVYWEN